MAVQRKVRPTMISAGHFHSFHRVPPCVARDKGWWKEEGLERAWVMVSSDDACTLLGLKLDSIQIGLDVKADAVFAARAAGQDVYMVGCMINSLPIEYIGAKDIKSVKDLKGKKVAYGEGGHGVNVPVIKYLLQKAGLTEKDVIPVLGDLGFDSMPNMGDRMEAGEFKATYILDFYHDMAMKSGYTFLGHIDQCFPERYPSRTIVVNGRYLREQPESLKAFLRSQLRALRFCKDPKNRKELWQIIERQPWEKGDEWGWDYAFDTELFLNGYLFTAAPWDGMPKGIDMAIADMKSRKELPDSFKASDVMRLDFIKEANEVITKKYGPIPQGIK